MKFKSWCATRESISREHRISKNLYQLYFRQGDNFQDLELIAEIKHQGKKTTKQQIN